MKKLLFVLCTLMPAIALADSDVTAEKASQNTPEGWTAVNLPSIAAITSANTLNITDYGASTASSDNTSAIQAALNDVPSAGGMVVIPAGTWLSGCLQVKSKTVLHLAAGATLKMLDHDTFPSTRNKTTGLSTRSQNLHQRQEWRNLNDIIIEGEGETSVIDGQGAPWVGRRRDCEERRQEVYRQRHDPLLTRVSAISSATSSIQNTPNTNLTIGQSGKGSHFTAHNVTIKAPNRLVLVAHHTTLTEYPSGDLT